MVGSKRFLRRSICADSLSLRILQWCSLSMISTWSHREQWSPFSFHMWSATPDFFHFPTSYSLLVFLKPHLKGAACFSFMFPSAAAPNRVHTVFSYVLLYGGSYSGEISAKCCQTFEGWPDVIWTADPLYFFPITPSHKADRLFSPPPSLIRL